MRTNGLSSGWRNVLSRADDETWFRLFIDAVQTGAVADLRLPVGDVGLVVGECSRGQALGLTDKVALYVISAANLMV